MVMYIVLSMYIGVVNFRITLATEMSLDEAVPDGAARPHSIPGLEWRFVSQRSGAETIPEHPSLNESSITYNRGRFKCMGKSCSNWKLGNQLSRLK